MSPCDLARIHGPACRRLLLGSTVRSGEGDASTKCTHARLTRGATRNLHLQPPSLQQTPFQALTVASAARVLLSIEKTQLTNLPVRVKGMWH
jgi:hypothetical protein